MKKILQGITLISLIVISACGRSNTNDTNLTPLQNQAVTYVRKHLERGDKLEEYKVVEEPMPAAIMEQPFLSIRNTVFKAGLDYQSCKTRGLEAGMQMAENKIENAKQQALATVDFLNQNIGGTESLIVLAKIKTPRSHDGSLQSLIVVFDPETMEAKEWIPVTTPVQNTVALVVCAQENTLAEYAKEQNHEAALLASKVNDPVLKFVLDAKPL